MSGEDELVRLLEETRGIRELLQTLVDRTVEQPSSIEVKTSARGADLAVKRYAGSPLDGLGDDAIAEYRRLQRELNPG